MASYGPGEQFNNAEAIVTEAHPNLSDDALNDLVAEHKLEHSYIGIIGKGIEPVIQPLGYDWKIGIGLVTSFAAREVFVGTLATIYSIGSADDIENEDEPIHLELAPMDYSRRITELQRRNLSQPKHLRTAYALETMEHDPDDFSSSFIRKGATINDDQSTRSRIVNENQKTSEVSYTYINLYCSNFIIY